MPESVCSCLEMVGSVLHWLGKHNEARILGLLCRWLTANKINSLEELQDLLETSNDNPNIVSLSKDL